MSPSAIVYITIAVLLMHAPQASLGSTVGAPAPSPSVPERPPAIGLKSVAAHPNIILGSHGIPTNHRQQRSPASLIVCNGLGCDKVVENCEAFDILQTSRGVCIPTIPFLSVIISQPGGGGIPFPVLIGPSGCDELDQIAAVNQCFNIGGPGFGDFLIVD